MSDASLRAQIKTLMEEVPGAGVIHDYERWTADQSAFLTMFRDEATKKIMGWEITRDAVPRVERLGAKYKITHSYRIKGYYGLKDADESEKSFGPIIDAIILKFITTQIPGSSLHTLPKVEAIGARQFGNVLCHHAEISIEVPEMVSPTSEEAQYDLLSVGLNYYLKPGDDIADAEDVVEFGTET